MQTTTQHGNCSPPPGTHCSGATERSPFRFQACLRLSWTSALLAVGITSTTTAGFSGLPALPTEFTGRPVHFGGPPSRRSATELIIKPCPLAPRTCCIFSPTSFSSVQFGLDFVRHCFFLPLHSKFNSLTVLPCHATWLRMIQFMMLVVIWFGLHWALSSFFDHHVLTCIQSSIRSVHN